MSRHVSATMILAALMVASGCAAQSGPPSAGPSASSLQAAQDILTTTTGSLHDRWLLFRAEQLLDRQCMQSLGLIYLITDPGPEPDTGIVTADDIGQGRSHTYGIFASPQTSTTGAAATPQDAYVAALPGDVRARYVEVLSGPTSQRAELRLPSGAWGTYATGGCVGRARTELYGDVRTALVDVLTPQDVRGLLQAQLNTDRRYQEALRSWQECMAGRGLKAGSPDAAINAMQSRAMAGIDQRELADRQATVVQADLACDARTRLRAITADARRAFLQRQSAQLIGDLEQIHQLRRAATERARRLLQQTIHIPCWTSCTSSLARNIGYAPAIPGYDHRERRLTLKLHGAYAFWLVGTDFVDLGG